MAVPATELHPRGAIAVVDAGIRLCARSADVWSLALPGAALVAAAVTYFAEAIVSGRRILLATVLLTAAWLARSLFQGAAAQHAEALLTQTDPPPVRRALRAALAHAPTLLITCATLLVVNTLAMVLTLGFAVFFLSAHLAAYAVAMKDAGHPLAIFGTCSRVLGPARSNTPGVRVALWLMVFVALNLHIAANAGIFLARKLAGMELTFLQRYASLDNPVWVTAMIALAFALMDPLRAAVAAILVVDGRVRQDGLDLQAAIGQLARRRARATGSSAAALLACVAVFFSSPARADEPAATNAQLAERLRTVMEDCGGSDQAFEDVDRLAQLGDREHSALNRFVEDVEQAAYDDDDCEGAIQRAEGGLPLIREVADALEAGVGPDPRDKAKDILSRPEFVEAPKIEKPEPAVEQEEAPPEEAPSWWTRFWKWVAEKLEELMKRQQVERTPLPSGGSAGGAFAWVVIVVLAIAVVGVVVWLALQASTRAKKEEAQVELAAVAGTVEAASAGALARPPDAWAHLADELAQAGDFREAIRHLYLAVLSRLHQEGAIDYDPGLSNWDYLRRFRGRDAWKTDFRELTFRFDYAFYGRALEPPVAEDAYRRFRSTSGRILSPAATPAEAARA